MKLKRLLRPVATNARFVLGGFQDPAPNWVKWRVMHKHFIKHATCVETGTYLGDTSAFLAKNFGQTYTLEPYKPLFEAATQRFENTPKVQVINASSEEGFIPLLDTLSGDVNFWLDGHGSGPGTHEAEQPTPIELELDAIFARREKLGNLSILVDDFRLFDNSRTHGYPSPNFLVDFANRMDMVWTVEKDMFVCKSQKK